MAMGWTEDLSVGIGIIDQQHKIWFDKANELFDAGKKGIANEFVANMLEFLDEYTKMHFRDEEKYMLSIEYPEYNNQKKLHTNFITELAKLKEEYSKSGGNIVVIINANQMVINWLINHISTQDKKIGQYVRGQIE